jgi:energy-coupling factor transporter ATP-binding protein EcfA2
MIAGQETPDEGAVKLGETVVLGYVDQNRTLEPKNTVWQEISGGQETVLVGKREMNTRAYLSSFNFRGTDQQKKVGDMSGGERNRLHLAKTLMTGSNLLLLDEPTNDLDVDTLRALEEALLDFSGCAVVISHDRWFLDRVADAHPRVRGEQRGGVARGELRVVHRGPEAPEGAGRRPAAPGAVQEAGACVVRTFSDLSILSALLATSCVMSRAARSCFGHQLSRDLSRVQTAPGRFRAASQVARSPRTCSLVSTPAVVAEGMRPGVASRARLGRHRWVVERTVERTFAHLNPTRRLAGRYEQRTDLHIAFLTLGCALLAFDHLTPSRSTFFGEHAGRPRRERGTRRVRRRHRGHADPAREPRELVDVALRRQAVAGVVPAHLVRRRDGGVDACGVLGRHRVVAPAVLEEHRCAGGAADEAAHVERGERGAPARARRGGKRRVLRRAHRARLHVRDRTGVGGGEHEVRSLGSAPERSAPTIPP